MPFNIANDVLEQSVSQALSLTGIWVELDNLQPCHCMWKKDRVIIKFKRRKQKHCVLSNCKTLQNKSLDLTQLKLLGEVICKWEHKPWKSSVGLQMLSIQKCM